MGSGAAAIASVPAGPYPPGSGWHSIVRSTIRRRRSSGCGSSRWRVLMYLVCCGTGSGSISTSLPFASVVYCGSSVFIGSATRTAPPCMSATPAAAAESFAIAIFSDIDRTLVACGGSMRPTRTFA
ncbi:hypothetical protein [Erythrobacter sp. JK5]|uniref:hypothetical protein n=1 Tax=Erythrobacter sp. JK5 TaxID=2829500 RepID=UPI001BA67CB2|nr:hypothetical protein [Erythrobacter sp. JK5]QUL37751.1 hypothetical protein KDC96_15660 [Erythrobacter sp. JK5]